MKNDFDLSIITIRVLVLNHSTGINSTFNMDIIG